MAEKEVLSFSDLIDEKIKQCLLVLAMTGADTSNDPFEQLLGLGELVDRLTIVNQKLYDLKDQVMVSQNDKEFLAWQAVEDVRLVEERARLKKCIDQKLIAMVSRIVMGDPTAGINPETKRYGIEC